VRAFPLALVSATALVAAGCGGSGSGPVDPVAARSSSWVRQANALCLPRDRAIRKAELAARPVFFTPAVAAEIHAEAIALRRQGVFRRIPLLAYKWRLALHRLGENLHPTRLDGQLDAAHRVAEPYGIRCHFGTIPLSLISSG